jgi:hypothetical protein
MVRGVPVGDARISYYGGGSCGKRRPRDDITFAENAKILDSCRYRVRQALS